MRSWIKPNTAFVFYRGKSNYDVAGTMVTEDFVIPNNYDYLYYPTNSYFDNESKEIQGPPTRYMYEFAYGMNVRFNPKQFDSKVMMRFPESI